MKEGKERIPPGTTEDKVNKIKLVNSIQISKIKQILKIK